MASSIKKTAVALATILTLFSDGVQCQNTSMKVLDPLAKKTTTVAAVVEEVLESGYENGSLQDALELVNNQPSIEPEKGREDDAPQSATTDIKFAPEKIDLDEDSDA